MYFWSYSNEKNRGKLWYTIALSIVIGMVTWGFLTKQYVMGFLIILVAGVTFFLENNQDPNTRVAITPLGIKINQTFYDFSKISFYSLIYDWEYAVILRLWLIKKGLKYVDIKVDNEIALVLKEILPAYLSQDESQEFDLIDRLIRMLKL